MRGSPTVVHEARRQRLAAVAILAGFEVPLGDGLPDGSRPDVVRARPGGAALFVGDAKDTEGAGGPQTIDRLARYVRLFVTLAVPYRPGSVFAVCGAAPAAPWVSLLAGLAEREAVTDPLVSVAVWGHECLVWWSTTEAAFTWRQTRPDRARARP